MKLIPLDLESRRYIHVTANNIIYNYDHQKEKEIWITKKYPMERCSKTIMKSEYEKEFYEEMMKDSFYYCAQDPGIYL